MYKYEFLTVKILFHNNNVIDTTNVINTFKTFFFLIFN